MKKNIINSIFFLAVMILVSSKNVYARESYSSQISSMISKYPMETKEILVNMDAHMIMAEGKETDLIKEMGISSSEKKKAFHSEAKMDEIMEENGYQEVGDKNGIKWYKSLFETKRLIVNCTLVPERYGAVDRVVKDSEFTILQFGSIEDTQTAYKQLQEEGYDVTIDYVLEDIFCFAPGEDSYLDKGTSMMGLDLMQKNVYYQQNTVNVAVIDTGIDSGILGNRVTVKKDFSKDNDINIISSTHGTNVAGIIADGTADNVKLWSLKVFNSAGKTTVAGVDGAISYAIENHADIINMSLGLQRDVTTKTLTFWNSSIDKAIENGIPVIVSSGNSGTHTDYCYPSSYDPCWVIGSIDSSKCYSGFENYGELDFVAPGSGITMATGETDSGTSFSAPYISAMAANLKGAKRYLSVEEEYNDIKAMCQDLGVTGYDIYYGNGMPVYTVKSCMDVHNYIFAKAVNATCTEDGYKIYVCSACGDTKTEKSESAIGHEYQSVILKAATCSATGIRIFTCSGCKDSYTEIISTDRTNHVNAYENIITNATCQMEGRKQIICNDCQSVVRYETIPKVEHDYTVTRTDPTGTQPGCILRECKVCRNKEKYILPATGTNTSAGSSGTQVSENITSGNSQTSDIKVAGNTAIVTNLESYAELKKEAVDKKISLKSVKNKKGRKIKVIYKKAANYSYQIMIATNKKFSKNVKTYKTSKSSYTIKNLKKNKVYYIRVRTARIIRCGIAKDSCYGRWSKVKKIKVKK